MIELIERWGTKEGKILYNNVLDAIKNNKGLRTVKGLAKHEGRWDLRGIYFPIPEVQEKVMLEFGVLEKFRAFRAQYALLENIDFSYSTFYRTRWERCIFKNSIFTSADFIQSHFYGCRFDKVTFNRSDINSCILGGSADYDAGSFSNSEFNECNLKKVYFNFPVIRKCSFNHSVITQTDFNSSRFTDCVFSGALNHVSFRGRLETDTSKGIAPNIVINEMNNVDFTRAELNSCNFSNGIDLSQCNFPPSSDYLVIGNKRNEVFREALLAIDFTWEEPYRSKVLSLIRNHYLHESKLNQTWEVLYRWSLQNKELSKKFFNVLRESFKKVNKKDN